MKAKHKYSNIIERLFFVVCMALLIDYWFIRVVYTLELYLIITSFISLSVLVILINAVGKRFGMIDLLAFMAPALWLWVPAIAYKQEQAILVGYEWLQMPVPFETYFNVALPGTLMLLLGIYFPIKSSGFSLKSMRQLIIEDISTKSGIGKRLVIFGIICHFTGQFVPASLGFLFALFSQFMYVGVCYLFFTKSKYNVLFYAAVFLFTALGSVNSGMFGSLIFWAALLAIVFLISRPIRLLPRILLAALGVFAVLAIQSIKTQYRAVAWYGGETNSHENHSSLLIELIIDRFENPDFLSDEETNVNFIHRFNQGRLTGLAINHTPLHEPFAEGETVFNALLGSFVPRIFWPNKPKAGGKENFERFTGQELVGNTSMNIAPLGDAYVNFGIKGGAVFLFFYGLFFNTFNQKLLKSIRKKPTLLFWTGLIWVQAVVVETDVVTVFNHVIKAIFLIALTFYISKKVFGISL